MLKSFEGLWTGHRSLRLELLAAIIARGSSAVLAFAFTWLIARLYGASGVGLYSLALTTTVICATFALTGIDYLLVRATSIAHRQGGRAIAAFIGQAAKRVISFALILALSLFLFRDWIAVHIFNDPVVGDYLAIMACALPALALTKIAASALRGMDRVITSQLIDGPLGTGVATLVLASIGLTSTFGPASGSALIAASLYAAASSGSAIVAWILVWRNWRKLPSGGKQGAGPPAISVRAGIPILLVVASNMFSDWFASVALAFHGDTIMVGQFRIAFMIVSVLNLLNVATDSILSPRIARAYHDGDVAAISAIVKSSATMLLVLASPALAIMIFFPSTLLGLFGPGYSMASSALVIMAMAQIISLAGGPVGTILVMTGHQRWSLAYGIVAAIISALLSWFLVPEWGINGAAVAVALAVIIRRIAALMIVHWVVGVHIWYRPGRS